MTGFFLKITRDNKPATVDVEEMTEPELRIWVEKLNEDAAKRSLVAVLSGIVAIAKRNTAPEPTLRGGSF